ncbi:MAG: c-type cytochrome [Anaerolineales bacterium]|nr:c-type cytochrome [Anaerolineales bacterium]
MIYRFRISLFLALAFALALAMPVLAGGWAVITLDELPMNVVVGEPLNIGFTVRQHGKTPLTGIDASVTIRAGLETLVFVAKEEGEPGHYVAALKFPAAGEWEWSIAAFGYDQSMPDLSVAAGGSATAVSIPAKAEPLSTLLIVRFVALGMGVLALGFAFRAKNRSVLALSVFCLLVGVGSFFAGSAVPAMEAKNDASNEDSVSQIELGQRLFIAKGCVTCHINTRVSDWQNYRTIELGATNLSNFSASPEVLRIRLKDPKMAKSDTQMPNLGLSDAEIEALIAFINSK